MIEKVCKIGKYKTMKAVVIDALKRYIQRFRQSKIIHLFGKVDYDSGYDYKEQRSRD